MTSQEQFLVDIEAFLARTGMAATTFGLRAVNDGKFVARIRGGGKVTLNTAFAVRAWMDAHDASRAEDAA